MQAQPALSLSATPVFPIYLEIEVGGKSKEELLAELQSNGFFVSNREKEIMGKPAWKLGKKETVKIARVQVRDLGFTKFPTTAQIWARIRDLGHSLCEPQDGPAIRLALKDQPRGDSFWLAMEQIVASDGGPYVFNVRRNDDGKPWLLAYWARSDSGWLLGQKVVFRLRK